MALKLIRSERAIQALTYGAKRRNDVGGSICFHFLAGKHIAGGWITPMKERARR